MERHTKAKAIADLNDAFRQSMEGGRVVISHGVSALPADDRVAIVRQVRTFEAFNAANDPDGAHNYGSFDQAGERILWKIDYYDAWDMTAGSSDPADPARTHRVLTVMLAHEY
jgi:hypothetical protein